MHSHSHPLSGLYITAGLISSLAAITVGAVALGYDFFSTPLIVNNVGNYVHIIRYIVGLAGIISLVGVFNWIMYPCRCK